MNNKKLFSALTSLTRLSLGIIQASLASALGFDRFGLSSVSCCLSLGHIARYAPSFRTAIYSMKSPKSQESNF